MGKEAPFTFVIDELNENLPEEITRKSMFGAHGLYVGEKIVFILRDVDRNPRDNGIWISVDPTANAGLRKEFKSLREIEMFKRVSENGFQGWLILPSSADDFEEVALALCALVVVGDPRIGKVPKKKLPRKKAAAKKKSPPSAKVTKTKPKKKVRRES